MNSVFYFSYALLQVPAGILGDKIGKKKSLFTDFYCSGPLPPSPAGPKAGAPCCSPVVTGAGEGTYYGPQYGLLRANPQKYRSLGSAIINSGMAFGIALGLMASSWLVYDRGYSWRTPFLSCRSLLC